MKTDDNILILDINMTAGHGGASGRFERLKTTALEYAFMLDLEGIRKWDTRARAIKEQRLALFAVSLCCNKQN